MEKADVLICGGGIVGLTVARELLRQKYGNIAILEKEKEIGMHSSGRNSGVLHAGIYYTPESLKARLCLKGNSLMKQYCREKNIPLLETGKVIVSRTESENRQVEELCQRASENGVRCELIDENRLKGIEPHARTVRIALFSPDTAVTDPVKVLASLERDLIGSGQVRILKGCALIGFRGDSEVMTDRGNVRFDTFVNAAGAYSDTIAHMRAEAMNYRLLPIKGMYKKLRSEKSYLVKGNIYPVPDTRNPFLGVHFTKAADGTVYVGPTAIPAFGRENYRGMEGIDSEAFRIVYRDLILFFRNPGFRKIALTEPGKYIPGSFFRGVRDLIEGLRVGDIEPSDKTGIRSQLIDWDSKTFVTDFVIIRASRGIHILNTVSPGFTSSMAVAEHVVRRYFP